MYISNIIKLESDLKRPTGFTLIEIVAVIAVLATLTSLGTSLIQRVFKDLENDEAQAHLNAVAAECLRIHSNNLNSPNEIPLPPSLDSELLERNNYELRPIDITKANKGNHCNYLQINPLETSSRTHFSMGFGISNGKITKFAIKNSESSEDIIARCELWAGKGNCLKDGNDYKDFFDHMDDVRRNRAICLIELENDINEDENPSNGGNSSTWEASASKDCANKTLPSNADKSSYTAGCSKTGCTKDVKIKDGKIVGIGGNAKEQYQAYVKSSNSEACRIAAQNYIEGDNEQPAEVTFNDCKNESGELVNIYICNDSEFSSRESYETCKIQAQINKCTIDLENIRNKTNGSYIVGKGADNGNDLNGLPPCGQKVWVYDNVIYYEEQT